MRIAIVGNSGSGKSTLARQLAAAHSLASLDLDTVAWEPGQVAVPRAGTEAAADVRSFCAGHDRWVVEGCYSTLVTVALERSPVLLFIDPGVDACLANCEARPWEPHKYASKAEQDAKLAFLPEWVKGYYTRDDDTSLVRHRALVAAYEGSTHVITSRADRAFVERLSIEWHGHDVDSLGRRFEACAIGANEWTHEAHLVVGLWHVHRYGADEALARLRPGIRRLNESHGGVNSATGGYHETITAAYVRLLAQFLDNSPRAVALGEHAVRLLAGPLAAKRVLMRFYSSDRLMSTEARAGWIDPDVSPLDIAVVGCERLSAGSSASAGGGAGSRAF